MQEKFSSIQGNILHSTYVYSTWIFKKWDENHMMTYGVHRGVSLCFHFSTFPWKLILLTEQWGFLPGYILFAFLFLACSYYLFITYFVFCWCFMYQLNGNLSNPPCKSLGALFCNTQCSSQDWHEVIRAIFTSFSSHLIICLPWEGRHLEYLLGYISRALRSVGCLMRLNNYVWNEWMLLFDFKPWVIENIWGEGESF